MKQNTTPTRGRHRLPVTKALLLAAGLLSTTAATAQQVPVVFSGTVFNDPNGIKDGWINGTTISTVANQANTSSSQLYVYLFNNANIVVDKAIVSAGNYMLNGFANNQYGIVLSTVNVDLGNQAPAPVLPSNWVYMAEGTPPDGDGFPDGLVAVAPANLNSIPNINFGLNRRPISQNYMMNSITYNSNGRIIIPAAAFTGSDPEDGVYPTGSVGRNVHLYAATNGTLYYDYGGTVGDVPITFVVANSFSEIENFDPSKLTLQPASNNSIFYFAFSVVDNGGTPEAVPNNASTPVALSIELQQLAARWKDKKAELSWTTETEQGTKAFYVERSTDGRNFTQIGTVQSKSERGISNLALDYTFEDAEAASIKGTIYYRIQELDIVGRTAAPHTALLNSNGTVPASGITAGPVPARGNLNVYVNMEQAQPVTVSLFDMKGAVVRSQQLAGGEHSQHINFDVSNLPAGNYILKAAGQTGYTESKIISVMR